MRKIEESFEERMAALGCKKVHIQGETFWANKRLNFAAFDKDGTLSYFSREPKLSITSGRWKPTLFSSLVSVISYRTYDDKFEDFGDWKESLVRI